MERSNGRYPYMRRQGSGSGSHSHNHHHHHHNSGANSGSSSTTSSSAASTTSSSAASTTSSTHNTQYSNNSINNAATATSSSAVHSSNTQYLSPSVQQNVPLTQHDELIRYIRGAWNKVKEQGAPIISCNESDNQLKNFKPFNLEEYWGQRLVQNIHVTTTHAGGHQ